MNKTTETGTIISHDCHTHTDSHPNRNNFIFLNFTEQSELKWEHAFLEWTRRSDLRLNTIKFGWNQASLIPSGWAHVRSASAMRRGKKKEERMVWISKKFRFFTKYDTQKCLYRFLNVYIHSVVEMFTISLSLSCVRLSNSNRHQRLSVWGLKFKIVTPCQPKCHWYRWVLAFSSVCVGFLAPVYEMWCYYLGFVRV